VHTRDGPVRLCDLTPTQAPQSYATEEPHIDVHVIEARLEQVQDHGLC
jgi:hypothetical protein